MVLFQVSFPQNGSRILIFNDCRWIKNNKTK